VHRPRRGPRVPVEVPEDGEERLVRDDDGRVRSVAADGVGSAVETGVGVAGYRPLERRRRGDGTE